MAEASASSKRSEAAADRTRAPPGWQKLTDNGLHELPRVYRSRATQLITAATFAEGHAFHSALVTWVLTAAEQACTRA